MARLLTLAAVLALCLLAGACLRGAPGPAANCPEGYRAKVAELDAQGLLLERKRLVEEITFLEERISELRAMQPLPGGADSPLRRERLEGLLQWRQAALDKKALVDSVLASGSFTSHEVRYKVNREVLAAPAAPAPAAQAAAEALAETALAETTPAPAALAETALAETTPAPTALAAVPAVVPAEALAAVPGRPAVLGVEHGPDGAGFAARIRLEARAAKYRWFTMDNPARIVVDVYGVRPPGRANRIIPVGDARALRIRTAWHPLEDKFRLVLDVSPSALAAFKVVSDDTGVAIVMP